MRYFSDQETVINYAQSMWASGEDALQKLSEPERSHCERIIGSLIRELERRVGQIFSTQELVEAQSSADNWCQDIVSSHTPSHASCDLDTVQNAAFYRYARRASDYMMTGES